MKLRPLKLPADYAALRQLDSAFVTDTIYHVEREGLAYQLTPQKVDPPVRKDLLRMDDYLTPESGIPEWWGYSVVAVDNGGAIIGLMTIMHEAWSERAMLWHLFVDAAQRGKGIGKLLLDEAVRHARDALNARYIRLDTSNLNYPGVQFYLKHGFYFCGLDETLYSPDDAPGETAIFFTLNLR